MGFTCSKTPAPTVTLTGIVTWSPTVESEICPLKVPATVPPDGKFAELTDTRRVEGAVPLRADKVSHAPPSAVVVDAVQVKVPIPAFLIWMFCAPGAAAPVASEKLNCPGTLSK